tara:strand:- start:285 stop:743 length:459 start_codon:yes stop_codon:yes gene_type:complete
MNVFNDINRQKMRRIQTAHHKAVDDNDLYDAELILLEMRSLCRSLLEDFATERNWIVAKTDFLLEQLKDSKPRRYAHRRSFIDHAEYLRCPDRPYRPVAIITHSYEKLEDMAEEADIAGVDIEILPWSWYLVDRCVAAIVTSREKIDAKSAA